jgi:hypothetical protein
MLLIAPGDSADAEQASDGIAATSLGINLGKRFIKSNRPSSLHSQVSSNWSPGGLYQLIVYW